MRLVTLPRANRIPPSSAGRRDGGVDRIARPAAYMATRARSVSACSRSTASASSAGVRAARPAPPRPAPPRSTRCTAAPAPARRPGPRRPEADARVRSSAPVSSATSACNRTYACALPRQPPLGVPRVAGHPAHALGQEPALRPVPVSTVSSRSVRRALTVSQTTGKVTVDGSAASTCATRPAASDGSSSHRSAASRTTEDSSLRPIARCSIACRSGSRQARWPSERVTANSGSYRPRRMPFSIQPRNCSNTMTSWPRRSVRSKRPSGRYVALLGQQLEGVQGEVAQRGVADVVLQHIDRQPAQCPRARAGRVPRLDRVGGDPPQVARRTGRDPARRLGQGLQGARPYQVRLVAQPQQRLDGDRHGLRVAAAPGRRPRAGRSRSRGSR